MTLQQYIKETEGEITQIQSTFYNLSDTGSERWSFSGIRIRVTPSITIYKRDIGDGLMSAHPDKEHGSAYGESATDKGDWSEILSSDGELHREGKIAFSDILSGGETEFSSAAIGTDDSPINTGDTELGKKIATRSASTRKIDDIARTSSLFLFTDHQESFVEVGIFDGSGDLIVRLVTDEVNPTLEEEIRVDIDFSFDVTTRGDSVFTDVGINALSQGPAEKGNDVALNQVSIGSGSSDPSGSDTQLDDHVMTKDALRESAAENVSVEAAFLNDEPSSQPVDINEVGVKDSEDRLIWRASVSEYEKTDEEILFALASFRLV